MNVSTSRRDWMKAAAVTAACLGSAAGAPAGTRRPAARRPAGPVRLFANENPFGPSDAARRAIADAVVDANRYVNQGGDLARLKSLIAAREGLTPEHVVVGAGSSEILCQAAIAFGLGGGELIAADPTFNLLPRYAEGVGAKVHRVPLDERFEHDLAEMNRRTTQSIGLVYVCNPNNPTGTLVPPERLRAFCEDVSRRAVVFVDEAYVEYMDAPARVTTVDLVRKGQNVIVLRTFSKIYGLAGMRIGYALAHPDLASRLSKFAYSVVNTLGVRAAIASLEDSEFVASSRRANVEARAATYRALDEAGAKYVPSHANFVYFRAGEKNRGLPAALAGRGLLLNPTGAPFSAEWARLTVGTPDEMRLFASAFRETFKA
jgi:histidinol-phosphate aminotransferase